MAHPISDRDGAKPLGLAHQSPNDSEQSTSSLPTRGESDPIHYYGSPAYPSESSPSSSAGRNAAASPQQPAPPAARQPTSQAPSAAYYQNTRGTGGVVSAESQLGYERYSHPGAKSLAAFSQLSARANARNNSLGWQGWSDEASGPPRPVDSGYYHRASGAAAPVDVKAAPDVRRRSADGSAPGGRAGGWPARQGGAPPTEELFPMRTEWNAQTGRYGRAEGEFRREGGLSSRGEDLRGDYRRHDGRRSAEAGRDMMGHLTPSVTPWPAVVGVMVAVGLVLLLLPAMLPDMGPPPAELMLVPVLVMCLLLTFLLSPAVTAYIAHGDSSE
eukprot:TRINITY_DN16315_c0_g2_i1.p1 TRINITY_DN16315_c0_g2~~TRINITY_DN16315_c0_g2_i1.p1  ORF type:complete len:348 (-),score=-46.48 TRINITY_DN16315_c0_g2_i1:83-1069(-)